MAFGLSGAPPADMLCGAGNKFVAKAKRQFWGRCVIDLLAGPGEIPVIADDHADPVLVACDLLDQAEHDPNSGIALICLSENFAVWTITEVEKQLKTLPTRKIASQSWNTNGMVQVIDNEGEAIQPSDDYAPEHLELQVENEQFFFERLTKYGSLFISEETTVAYRDKSIGTNHILPTSHSARYTGGVCIGKFLKTCTYQRMTRSTSRVVGEVTERQCNVE